MFNSLPIRIYIAEMREEASQFRLMSGIIWGLETVLGLLEPVCGIVAIVTGIH